MTAYMIVEASIRDEDSRARYSSQVGPILQQFGGEIIAHGPWELLFGEPAFDNGLIVQFPDKEIALAWYNSPAYQALVDLRTAGLDCRFRLIG
jgi:uncharacterized protein (DUF1330 family)